MMSEPLRRLIAVIFSLITIALVSYDIYSFILEGQSLSFTTDDMNPCLLFFGYPFILPAIAILLVLPSYQKNMYAYLFSGILLVLFIFLFVFLSVFAGFVLFTFVALVYSIIVAWIIELVLASAQINHSALAGSILFLFIAEFFLFIANRFIRIFHQHQKTIHLVIKHMLSEKKFVAKMINLIVLVGAAAGGIKLFIFTIFFALVFAATGETLISISNLPIFVLAFIFTSIIPRSVWKLIRKK
jgi:hypothetical protein